MKRWFDVAAELSMLSMLACTSTGPMKADEPTNGSPSRTFHDQPGAIETDGPAGVDVEHDYCRPGTQVSPDRIIVPQAEVGISVPVGSGRDDEDQGTVVPYSRSSCVPQPN